MISTRTTLNSKVGVQTYLPLKKCLKLSMSKRTGMRIYHHSGHIFPPKREVVYGVLRRFNFNFLGRLLGVEELKPILQYLSPGELSYARYYASHLIHEAGVS